MWFNGIRVWQVYIKIPNFLQGAYVGNGGINMLQHSLIVKHEAMDVYIWLEHWDSTVCYRRNGKGMFLTFFKYARIRDLQVFPKCICTWRVCLWNWILNSLPAMWEDDTPGQKEHCLPGVTGPVNTQVWWDRWKMGPLWSLLIIPCQCSVPSGKLIYQLFLLRWITRKWSMQRGRQNVYYSLYMDWNFWNTLCSRVLESQ